MIGLMVFGVWLFCLGLERAFKSDLVPIVYTQSQIRKAWAMMIIGNVCFCAALFKIVTRFM